MKKFLERNYKTTGAVFVVLAVMAFILQVSIWLNVGEPPAGVLNTFIWILNLIWGLAVTVFFIIFAVKSFDRELFD